MGTVMMAGRSCHDGCTHIPMLAWGGPFARGGQRVEELVSLIDIPPTLLASSWLDRAK